MASNTEKVHIQAVMEINVLVFGKVVNAQNGLMEKALKSLIPKKIMQKSRI